MSSGRSFNDQIQDFNPEDGSQWDSWHFTAPLFDDFFILGPKNFLDDVNPTVLYRYPNEDQDDQYHLSKFVFIDGLHWENVDIKDFEEANNHIASDYPDREEIVITRPCAGQITYMYCLRFIGSAFTRPAIKDNQLFEDAKYFRGLEKLPSCRFAFCFVSVHPFHSLLFRLLNMLLDIETKYRISALNLITIAANQNYVKSGKGSDIVYWPESTVDFRTACLEKLYQTALPTYGENMCFCLSGSEPTFWRMPKREDVDFHFPIWGCTALFNWISLPDFISLIAFLLTENYITVVGSNVEMISKCATCLPYLIRPFFWTCPVIALLPPDMSDLFDSPMVTILGVHRRFAKFNATRTLVIDIDEHKIIFPSEIPKFRLPKEISLLNLLSPVWESQKFGMQEPTCETILRIVFEFITDTFVKPHVNSLLTKVTSNGPIGTIFNPELFLSFFPKEDNVFLDRLMETQLFMGAREQLCRMKTKYSDFTEENNDTISLVTGCITPQKKSPCKFTFNGVSI